MPDTTFTYQEFKPAEPLQRFIQCYWIARRNADFKPALRYIFADGLSEIFANLSTSGISPFINGIVPLKPGRVYFGGTMTSTNTIISQPDTVFAGVRLKPGGISAFYKFNLLELVDEIIELSDPGLYAILTEDPGLKERLDKFFLHKLDTRILPIISMSEFVDHHQGRITVDELAKRHHISRRSLERHFNSTIGIGPKEFIKVIRFHHLVQKLQKKESSESLLRIAYEMGYYDHAHLTKEVKRYGGQTPSELLSF